jgi:hypothetical protein
MSLAPILPDDKEKKMITFIVVVLTLLFVLGSISPLLITEDIQNANVVEKRPCSCDCSQ